MELNHYIGSEYFTGTIPTNLEAPKLPDFSTPVEYSTGSGGVEFGIPMKEIQLTRKRVALVDNRDYEQLNQWNWYANKNSPNHWYACRRKQVDKNRSLFLMHRVILKAPRHLQVDHINGDGLDNRRINLRLCTQSQNSHNQKTVFGSSKYKGVYWNKIGKQWRAHIGISGKVIHLGYFRSEKKAALAYDEIAIKLVGEFAFTNQMRYPRDFN